MIKIIFMLNHKSSFAHLIEVTGKDCSLCTSTFSNMWKYFSVQPDFVDSWHSL